MVKIAGGGYEGSCGYVEIEWKFEHFRSELGRDSNCKMRL